jgi:UDP-glucose 4-epimerase
MKMLNRIEREQPPIVYGDGSQAYDFVYVSDCARANVLAMKATSTDEAYNIGSGTRTTIKELADLVLELTGKNLTIQYETTGSTFVKNRVGCPRKAEREIGFKADVPLRAGLEKLIEWRMRSGGSVAFRRP